MATLDICKERRTLAKIAEAGNTALKDDIFSKKDEDLLRAMLRQDFVSIDPVYHTRLALRPQGYARLRELKHNRCEFIRWLVTTGIALIALVRAFFP